MNKRKTVIVLNKVNVNMHIVKLTWSARTNKKNYAVEICYHKEYFLKKKKKIRIILLYIKKCID